MDALHTDHMTSLLQFVEDAVTGSDVLPMPTDKVRAMAAGRLYIEPALASAVSDAALTDEINAAFAAVAA